MRDIVSDRLILRLVPLAGLAATAATKLELAEKLIGAKLPPLWSDEAWVFKLRYDQWLADPEYAPWSIRAIIKRDTGETIGNINAHHKPMPFIMNGQQTAGTELGYTIFDPHRRKGYATEAIMAYTSWAGSSAGVSTFVLSIDKQNEPSLQLARKLGAEQIGTEVKNEAQHLIHAFQRVLPNTSR